MVTEAFAVEIRRRKGITHKEIRDNPASKTVDKITLQIRDKIKSITGSLPCLTGSTCREGDCNTSLEVKYTSWKVL